MTTTPYALALSPAERTRYRMMAEHARAGETADWVAAGIGAGAAVADVGCGPGAVLRLLAEEVGPTGSVVGIDADPAAVALAAEEVAGFANASVRQGSAAATGLAADSQDVVVCRNVLAHNGGQEQAIVDHLATLARPGGAVYLVDLDVALVWVHPDEPDLDDLDRRYAAYQTARGNDMHVGRRLGDLLAAAGLTVETFRTGGPLVRVPPGVRRPAWAARDRLVAAGMAGPADLARWDAAYARQDGWAQRPWANGPLVVAVGRKR